MNSPVQTSSFSPAPFQLEDMEHLAERDWSSNWSEMGCFKTSTVLWLIDRWAKRLEIENPRVLVITTRSGKGTYFKHVPIQLPHYETFNLLTADCRIVMADHEFSVGSVPTSLNHPSIFVSHYNVFTKRKKKKKDPEPEPEVAEPVDILEEMMEELFQEEKAKERKAKAKVPLIDDLLKIEWDIVILDEAHRIKGRSTGWTREIKKLKAKVKHVMTGTGFINDPSEIWSLLHFLNRSEFSSYWRFRETYCAEDVVNGFRKIVGINPDTQEEFKDLVRVVGPRRTKREVFKNLPEPLFTPYEVELNAIQRKMYESIRDELYALDQAGTPIFAPNVLAALQRLRQVCVATPHVMKDYYSPKLERRVQEIKLFEPSSKLDALMDILEGLEWDEERRDQVVVFSNFKDPIDLAKKRFDTAGISYLEMKASDNDRSRYEKWALEFPKKNHQVFICTLQLGSESISLTSASTCVFLDRSWSPKDNDQGVSRVWRPGQEEVANIININAKGTVDGRILAANQRKTGWFKAIFD